MNTDLDPKRFESCKGKIVITNCIIVICVLIGLKEVLMLSKHVRKVYRQAKHKLDEDTWPPEQLTKFIPVVVMHHCGHYNSEETVALAELLFSLDLNDVVFATGNQYIIAQHPKLKNHSDHFQTFLNTSKVTKDVEEILAPLEENDDPQLMLIEGAPGIGKTVLLKEIAYRWSKGSSLSKFKLVFLLCLRDQRIQQLSSVGDLIDNFLKYHPRHVEIAELCNDYFFENGGEDILFLLDGFDELPKKLKEDSLIASIIKRMLFPECSIIITSRPHATIHLRRDATCRVDVLGFTEDEKVHFIQSSLKQRPKAIIKLTQYLNIHSSINNLCSVPFNIAALLFLYKQNIPLPKNSTELYDSFICQTICCHLAKHGKTNKKNVTNFENFPDLYCHVIQKLSFLSLSALDIDRLVFTLEEIKRFCPEIETVPEAINGFGILQAVEYFGISCSRTTFNFVHYSVQEYLAAYCVAKLLLPDEELKILQQKFWSNTHSNMFSMYVAMTKGQNPAFKRFLSDGNCMVRIANKFLDDQLKCLRLFKCFYEAEDEDMYSYIEKATVFKSKAISLRFNKLSPSDMECLGLFLTSSANKHWQALNLTSCYIKDHDIRALHHAIVGAPSPIKLAINAVDLPANYITSSSDICISDLVINCSIRSLGASGNKSLGETLQFYTMISHPLSVLEYLWLAGNRLTTTSATFLFKSLRKPNKIKWLIITDNLIDDGICDEIVATLQTNTTLQKLLMSSNPISSEGANKVIDSLFSNDTLSTLWLPGYPDDVTSAMKSKLENVNENRRIKENHAEINIKFVDIQDPS